MITRRELAIILATLCIITTLFMTRPVLTQETRPYDPWRDINDDGVVGPYDLAAIIASYRGTGDPTKNVNVTNWPATLFEGGLKSTENLTLAYQADNSGGGTWFGNVDGYTQTFVYVQCSSGVGVTIYFSTGVLGVGNYGGNLNPGQIGYWQIAVQGPLIVVSTTATPGFVTICVYAIAT